MVDVVLSRMVHLFVAALWAGSVVYVAWVVLPLARDGAFSRTEPLAVLMGRLRTLSRASAVILLLTGGHLAAAAYTADSLLETTNGQLVLAMTALWLVLIGLVEVATARFDRGLDEEMLRSPAHETITLFRAAAVVAIVVMLVAGAISANAVQVL